MSSSEQAEPNPYTSVIDLTQKAQRAERDERTASEFTLPEPPLPDSTVENLPPRVQAALSAAGWNSLMPVQEKGIPYLLEGRDLIVQSRTGSGKTGAFLLPMFELLDPSFPQTQVLILTPTRELARQIHEEFQRMARSLEGEDALRAALVYGGVRYKAQLQAFSDGAHIVIGTPGRILDHLERKSFSLNALQVLILDEADEMLSMGFYPAMRALKRYLPRERQSYMFSATMPPKVRSLAHEFLDDPGFLSLSTGNISVDEIEHRLYNVDAMEKDRVLVRLLEMENPDSAIIFANTKRDVEYLAKFLNNFGYEVGEISGDLTQRAREEVMDRIRTGKLRLLVATDVAARGIDISDLSHVFMYDVPQDPEYYIHRSGRTARAGKTGTALALTTRKDLIQLRSITNRYGIEIEEHAVPTDADVQVRIAERMTVVLEAKLREKTNLERERFQRFIPLVGQLAQEEPELLAMLVDELYLTRSNLMVEEGSEQQQPAERVQKRKGGSSGGHSGGRKSGRGGGRRSGGRESGGGRRRNR